MPANHIRLKLWINHVTKGGFSESYAIPTTDYSIAAVYAKDILDYRALLLGGNTEIVYHSMSIVDAARDSEVVPSFLSQPEELDTETGNGAEVCNVLEDGMSIRLYTADGKHTSFVYRALRDSWVEDEALTITPTAQGSLVLAAAAAGFTAANAIASFVNRILYRTVHVKKTGPGAYTLTEWSAVRYTGVKSRDTGAGYHYSRGRRRATI